MSKKTKQKSNSPKLATIPPVAPVSPEQQAIPQSSAPVAGSKPVDPVAEFFASIGAGKGIIAAVNNEGNVIEIKHNVSLIECSGLYQALNENTLAQMLKKETPSNGQQ